MTVYSFPLHDTQDYKGRIIFTAVKENYRTWVNTAIQAARGEGGDVKVDVILSKGVQGMRYIDNK